MLAKEPYKESLPLLAREKYERKLKLVRLHGREYPYALAEMWADDVRKWPSIEFPDIVLYLIDTPSEYTREKLKIVQES